MQPPSAIAIFARAPSSGKAKTRLIPLLGAQGAARFQAALVSDAIRKVNSLRDRVACYLFFSGRAFAFPAGPRRWTLGRQQGRDLGERLARAFRRLLSRYPAVVIIGTDSPTMPARILRAALRELRFCEAVLGPCPDGGFYLIGLRRPARGLPRDVFRGIRWGSRLAFRDTQRRLLAHSFSCSVLEPFADVDRPEDLRRLLRELASKRAARRLAPATWIFSKIEAGDL